MKVPGEQRGPTKGTKVRNGSLAMEAATHVRTVDMENQALWDREEKGCNPTPIFKALLSPVPMGGGASGNKYGCVWSSLGDRKGTKQAAALRGAKSPLRLGPKRLENQPWSC